MNKSYIRKFSPNAKHFTGVAFVVVGVVLMMISIYRTVRVSSPVNIENCHTLCKGQYISGSLNAVYGYLNGADKENTLYVSIMESDGRTVDPTSLTKTYITYAGGKYRCLSVDTAVSPQAYDFFSGGVSDKSLEIVGIVQKCDEEVLASFIRNYEKYYGGLFYGGEEIPQLDSSNTDVIGIRIVDPKREKRIWLYALLFLIVGVVLMLWGGNPYVYCAEQAYK